MKIRLKELRTERGISQAELADALNVSRNTIVFLENTDQIPSLKVLLRIADYFNCSIDYILYRNNSKMQGVEYIPVYYNISESILQKHLSVDSIPIKKNFLTLKGLDISSLYFLYVNDNNSERIIKKDNFILLSNTKKVESTDILLISINDQKPSLKLCNIEDNHILLKGFDKNLTEDSYSLLENKFTVLGKYVGKFEI